MWLKDIKLSFLRSVCHLFTFIPSLSPDIVVTFTAFVFRQTSTLPVVDLFEWDVSLPFIPSLSPDIVVTFLAFVCRQLCILSTLTNEREPLGYFFSFIPLLSPDIVVTFIVFVYRQHCMLSNENHLATTIPRCCCYTFIAFVCRRPCRMWVS